MTDEVLEKIKRGDKEALGKLFLAYKDKVYNLAYRISGGKEEAEDIVQETFIKIFYHLKNLKENEKFPAYLYRMVINLSFDKARKERRLVPLMENNLEKVNIENQITDKLNFQEVLNKLSPKLRNILILREIENLSYQDIAETLKCSKGTVMSRLNRARKMFSLKLREE